MNGKGVWGLAPMFNFSIDEAPTCGRGDSLKADESWTDDAISQALDVGMATVGRIRRKYADGGLNNALNRKVSSRQYEYKIDGKVEAHLVALVCGKAPEGYARWTLRLLADRLVRLEQVKIESVSHETVRQALKKTN